jgi:hypothetical protein
MCSHVLTYFIMCIYFNRTTNIRQILWRHICRQCLMHKHKLVSQCVTYFVVETQNEYQSSQNVVFEIQAEYQNTVINVLIQCPNKKWNRTLQLSCDELSNMDTYSRSYIQSWDLKILFWEENNSKYTNLRGIYTKTWTTFTVLWTAETEI